MPASLALLAPLALTACPSFAVGPEAFEVAPTSRECELAELEPESCTRFVLDNGPIYDADEIQPLVLRLGFEASERNLEFVTVSYERPGAPPVEHSCDFGLYDQAPQGGSTLRCSAVALAGTTSDEIAPVRGAAQGVLEISLDVLADSPGPHALSAWLTDANDYESVPVRWQFSVLEPVRE
ncbi:MAG: hypothetical protein KDK70_17405 [Myxococcales bacterium]|nr:hypothetical protein [Myxococcales bacterium]